jgi:hypothetical protein
MSRVPVAHTCDPSYSGGRNQVDHGSKPAWASLRNPISKIPFKKRASGVSQGEGSEFKPQYHKKKEHVINVIWSKNLKTSEVRPRLETQLYQLFTIDSEQATKSL